MKRLGIYIHVPFCTSKCLYCDFNSCANMEAYIPDYFEALQREIDESKVKAEISSIFIGGGTPSVVDPSYIGLIMEKISNKFIILDSAEITIECNPGTLNIEKLSAYRKFGINRISMGLQAVQPELLNTIGRKHSYADFERNFHEAKKVGFENINSDLMFSLPNQSKKDWVESLDKMVELGVPHISCYSLKIEEGTPFHKLNEEGNLALCNEDEDREMYEHAREVLLHNGYVQYEISNFAKPGYECAHNILYWMAREYIGFGVSAHSYLNDYRAANLSNISEYIDGIKSKSSILCERVYISKEESMSEYMILGLRLLAGVDKHEFFKRYGVTVDDLYGEKLEKLCKLGLITNDKNTVKLTIRGLDLANQVMMEFI